MLRLEFEAIGTRWQIDIYDELSSLQLNELDIKIQKRITDFDLVYSRFKENSLVMKMSSEKGTYELPEDSRKLMSLYKKLYEISSGLFTPLIGQALSDAGYDASYSLKTKKMTQPKKWDEVILFEDLFLTILEPALLDFGAGGKGYLIDLVSQILEQEHVSLYCIDAGGDIVCRDKKYEVEPFKIGLENPENTEQVIGVALISNQSICGSAGNRRAWGEFHHMIDPISLKSPRHILASWVIADDALTADALATALFFVSKEILATEFQFQCVLLHANFSVEKSSDFRGELFYNG